MSQVAMRCFAVILLLFPLTSANRGGPQVPRQFSSPTGPSSSYTKDGLANALGDLFRFEFSGSVETHVIGPKQDEEESDYYSRETMDSSEQLPLVELETANSASRQFLLNGRLIPSLFFGADYDFGQRQRKWHGISCLFSRLRFRPVPGVAIDVVREQAINHTDESSSMHMSGTSLQFSWKGYHSSFRKASQQSSLLVSVPVVPARLRWECCLSSGKTEPSPQGIHRSGWLIDAMGQIQGSHSIQLTQHANARCFLRRRIRWISGEEGTAESTHVGLTLQFSHGNQQCHSTLASFAAQLEQIQESAQVKVRHDLALR